MDIRRVSEAPKRALVLVEDPEKLKVLEHFLDNAGPLIDGAVREMIQDLVNEINIQLAPQARLRLVQEGTKLVPEIVGLGDEQARTRRMAAEEVSKVLIRMPSDVKAMATDAAQKAGTSLNTWTVNILERTLVSLRERQPKTEEKPTDEEGEKSPSDSS